MQKIFKDKPKTIAIKVPAGLHKKLKAKGVNISELIRNFLNKFLSK